MNWTHNTYTPVIYHDKQCVYFKVFHFLKITMNAMNYHLYRFLYILLPLLLCSPKAVGELHPMPLPQQKGIRVGQEAGTDGYGKWLIEDNIFPK